MGPVHVVVEHPSRCRGEGFLVAVEVGGPDALLLVGAVEPFDERVAVGVAVRGSAQLDAELASALEPPPPDEAEQRLRAWLRDYAKCRPRWAAKELGRCCRFRGLPGMWSTTASCSSPGSSILRSSEFVNGLGVFEAGSGGHQHS